MKSFRTHSDAEFLVQMIAACMMFAANAYRDRHPNATEPESLAYAGRNWKLHKEEAVTCVAACELDAQVQAAAPLN